MAVQDPVSGSYSPASLSFPPPPVISTVPSANHVRISLAPPVDTSPIAVQDPVAGSYNSADCESPP